MSMAREAATNEEMPLSEIQGPVTLTQATDPGETERARKSRKKPRLVSQRKVDANRRNAQKSTGPKSEAGKRHSRLNALKHGILTSDLVIMDPAIGEKDTEFLQLLRSLRQDIQPVGAREEILVEKIAICCWRQKRVLRCEASTSVRQTLDFRVTMAKYKHQGIWPELVFMKGYNEHLCIPTGNDLDRILRYDTANNRQLYQALNQLERLQRARKGDLVPAPVAVQVTQD
jgi:hypothetical protein